jgi:hypothetical protein
MVNERFIVRVDRLVFLDEFVKEGLVIEIKIFVQAFASSNRDASIF